MAQRHTAPQLEYVEFVLRNSWQETLGCADIQPTDNFFDAGGDSLSALILTARIAEQLGIDVDVEWFLENSTFDRALSTLLLQNEAKSSTARCLIKLPSKDFASEPVIACHNISGEVFHLRDLPDVLQRTVWAIRSAGLRLNESAAASVEEMAARYAEEVMAGVVPPYRIVGYSGGTLVAHAVAAALLGKGQPVHLWMLDPPMLPNAERLGAALSVEQIVEGRLERFCGTYGIEWRGRSMADLTVQLRDAGALPATVSVQRFERTLEVWASNARAITTYVPRGTAWPKAFVYTSLMHDNGGSLVERSEQELAEHEASWRPYLSSSSVIARYPVSHREFHLQPAVQADLRRDLSSV